MDEFKTSTLDEFHVQLVKDATQRLHVLDKNRNKDDEFRCYLLGEAHGASQERARSLEVRGISRYHLRKGLQDPGGAESQAFEDLLAAEAIRPLNPEATTILASLQAAKEAMRQQTEQAAKRETAKQEVEEAAQQDAKHQDAEELAQEAVQRKQPQSKPAGAKGTDGSIAKAQKESQGELHVAPQVAKSVIKPSGADDSPAKQVMKSENSNLAKLEGAEETKPHTSGQCTTQEIEKKETDSNVAELSISVEQQEKVTIITVTPAQDVQVDAREGMIRFCLGDKFRDVPVDGVATEVKRRRGCLRVTVRKSH